MLDDAPRRAAIAGLAALPAFSAAAETPFPSKPLTMIVPFPAGGPADNFRALSCPGHVGQPETASRRRTTRAARAGVTGMDFVAKSDDAHVMGLMSASAGAIMQSLMPKMPYRPDVDIAPVILVVRIQEVLVVNAKFGVSTFQELLAKLKANPGKYSYGSAGTGGITHLATELVQARNRHGHRARALSRRRARDQRPGGRQPSRWPCSIFRSCCRTSAPVP
ncbi:MAG: tripartite tricarboxylate transporter substrate-binding protein [Hyphomicrobium sp.]